MQLIWQKRCVNQWKKYNPHRSAVVRLCKQLALYKHFGGKLSWFQPRPAVQPERCLQGDKVGQRSEEIRPGEGKRSKMFDLPTAKYKIQVQCKRKCNVLSVTTFYGSLLHTMHVNAAQLVAFVWWTLRYCSYRVHQCVPCWRTVFIHIGMHRCSIFACAGSTIDVWTQRLHKHRYCSRCDICAGAVPKA